MVGEAFAITRQTPPTHDQATDITQHTPSTTATQTPTHAARATTSLLDNLETSLPKYAAVDT